MRDSQLPDDKELPAALRKFIDKGGSKYRGEEDDWEIKVEDTPSYLVKSLPPRSLIIGNNGSGDYLFLTAPESSPRSFGTTVYVYWHEGPEVEVYLDQLRKLTQPPPPVPTKRGPVFYSDGVTRVMLGDRVHVRGCLQFWRRFPGTVNYVPGISRKNTDMEYGGLGQVGIVHKGRNITAVVVDPKTSSLDKGVQFLSRATSPVRELGPEEELS